MKLLWGRNKCTGHPRKAPHVLSARGHDSRVFFPRRDQLTGPPSSKQYSEASTLSE